jgi:hypothetical protein
VSALALKFGPMMRLNVLTYQEDDLWIARCLEMDIIGHGDTREEATECLAHTMFAHMEAAKEHGFNIFRPAPREYWEAYFLAANKELARAKPEDLPASPAAIRENFSLAIAG